MKSLIHSGNYESYYLDYLEGTLSQEECVVLEAFLAEHPEYQIDDINVQVEPVRINYSSLEKSLLLKHESTDFEKNLDFYSIAFVENLLDSEKEMAFKHFLFKNKEAKQTVHSYLSTRLDAEVILFPRKEDLKRKELALIPFWKWPVTLTGTAAAIALLVFQYTAKQTNTVSEFTASRTNPKEKTVSDSSLSLESTPKKLSEENQIKVFAASPTKYAEKTLIPFSTSAGEASSSGKTTPTLLPEVSPLSSTVTASITESLKNNDGKDFAYIATPKSDDSQGLKTANKSTEATQAPAKTEPEEKKGFFMKIGSFFEVSSKKAGGK